MNSSDQTPVSSAPPPIASPAQPSSSSDPASSPGVPPSSSPVLVEQSLNPLYHLKHAWKLFTQRWVTYVGIQLVSFILSIPFYLILFGVIFYNYFALEKADFEKYLPMLQMLILPLFIGILLIVLVLFISQLALMIAVFKNEQKVNAIQAYKEALKQFLPYSVFAILEGFIIIGGYLFFFIPGFIFSIWFSFATIIFLTEKERSFPSLLKSREYVRNHSIEVFVCMFLYWIFIVAINYLPTLFVSMVTGGNEQADMYVQIVMIPMNLILSPLALLYTYSIYKSLKSMKKEPIVLPSKAPYVLVATLGFGLVIVLGYFFITSIVSRISDYYTNRNTGQNEFRMKSGVSRDTQVAIINNPEAQANNVSRKSDVFLILSAIYQYSADNRNFLPRGIPGKPIEISSKGADICSDLVPKYLPELPVDPNSGTGENIRDCTKPYATGYYIYLSHDASSTNGTAVTVYAPGAEIGAKIDATR